MLATTIKSLWPPLALLACLGLSACSWNFPWLYRIPIQQGNVITVEMLQELKLGMDKRQVSFVLGTPLVTDAFHLDRWDYFYSYESGSGERVEQHASLFFEENRLARIDANMDSKIDFHTVTKATENALIVPPKKKGGFFAALTPAFLERDEEEAKQDEIAKSLSTGFNEQQPGSGVADGEVLDPALAAPAAIEPAIGAGATPSESYTPNASGKFDATGTPPTEPGTGTGAISAEVESQSKYLEQLFENFGSASASTAAPAESAVSEAPDSEPAVSAPNAPKQTTRD